MNLLYAKISPKNFWNNQIFNNFQWKVDRYVDEIILSIEGCYKSSCNNVGKFKDILEQTDRLCLFLVQIFKFSSFSPSFPPPLSRSRSFSDNSFSIIFFFSYSGFFLKIFLSFILDIFVFLLKFHFQTFFIFNCNFPFPFQHSLWIKALI